MSIPGFGAAPWQGDNNTYLHARTAIRLPESYLANNVLKLWARQDSLWSNYPFRATHWDREWRDRLCQQSLDVARMLQQFKRYSQALDHDEPYLVKVDDTSPYFAAELARLRALGLIQGHPGKGRRSLLVNDGRGSFTAGPHTLMPLYMGLIRDANAPLRPCAS